MKTTVLINGKVSDCLPVDDRGFHYGDGLFETIRFDQGELQFWHAHMQRLLDGCARLGIPQPDIALLHSEAKQLMSAQDRGVIKIILTRGSGGRGYRPAEQASPNRVVSIHPLPDIPEHYSTDGIHLYACQTPVSINPALAGIKSLCRLEQVQASREFDQQQFQEGLMLSSDGNVIEGTKTNVFIVWNNGLFTPSLEQAGVDGIMRKQLISLAKENGILVTEAEIQHDRLVDADELFVCNSVIGIWPVRRYNDKDYSLGDITRALMNALAQEKGRRD